MVPLCGRGWRVVGVKPMAAPVHPHVRGDGRRDSGIGCSVVGSPPRAWGRPDVEILLRLFDRFTPTCVGTAAGRTGSGRRPSVHPHVRGDGSASGRSASSCNGSPPRAWGRRGALHRRIVGLRFTPTCVGTARFPKIAPASNPVHPHVRGDGVVALHHRSSPVGSPPRAWGRLL